MNVRRSMVLTGLCVVIACAEAVAPSRPDTESLMPLANMGEPDICFDGTHNEIPCPEPVPPANPTPPAGGEPDETPPPPDADVPAEFTFTSFGVTYTELTVKDRTATAHGFAEFFANRGTGRTDLLLRNSTGAAYSALPGEVEYSSFLPWNSTMDTWATLGITTTCGGTIEASSKWTIMFEYPTPTGSLWQWQKKARSASANPVMQNPCDPTGQPAPSTPSGGSGGGGKEPPEAGQTCYWLVTWNVHTGEVLQETFMGCDPQ